MSAIYLSPMLQSIVVQVAGCMLAALLAGFLVSRLGRRFVLGASTLGAAMAFLLFAYLSRMSPQAVSIQIVGPDPGNTVVEKKVTISGMVYPHDARVYVLVHPLSSRKIWVQDLPSIAANGTWHTAVYLGTDSLGIGESYEIIALATREGFSRRVLRGMHLQPGQEVDGISANFSRSPALILKRSR